MSAYDRALAAQALAATGTVKSRLHWWARSYDGLRPRFPVMAAPPTVTIGGATSTINGNFGYLSTAQWSGGKIALPGPAYIAGGNPQNGKPQVTTYDDDTIGAGPCLRARFITSASALEMPFNGVNGRVNAIVDGEFVSRTRGLAEVPGDGQVHQVKFDFGATAASYYTVSIGVVAGGSGYALGDTITLAGGSGTAATLTVTRLSGSAVSQAMPKSAGGYTAIPTGTIAQAATSGAGSGATFGGGAGIVWAQRDTTRRSRAIEILFSGGGWGVANPFSGIQIAATESIQPWPVNPRVPRLFVLGDSQQDTFVDYPGGEMGASIAQRLGLWDGLVISNNGGTGYLTPNPGVFAHGLPWADSRRVADVVRQAPDIVLIIGGQNDGIGGANAAYVPTAAALTAGVTGMLNALLAALPKTLFVGVGPVTGDGAGTITNAIAAGWSAAADQRRVRFIHNNGGGPFIGLGGRVTAANGQGPADWMVSSDTAHLVQAGYDHWADIAAVRIGDALVAMISP